jgi:hypothetical protein
MTYILEMVTVVNIVARIVAMDLKFFSENPQRGAQINPCEKVEYDCLL